MKKTASGLIAAALGLTAMTAAYPASFPSTPTLNASAADAAVIDTTTEYQTIRGFGGIDMQEWQSYRLSDAECATAFGNGDNQLGLTVLRVYVNPDSSKWNLALPVAQYASKAGATVFATPWEPPSNLCESGGSNGKLHLKKANYGAYAKHLNDFGTYMKSNGVDLYSISVQNEPDYAKEWTYWSPDETTDFIANYGDQITSTRLMSPETFQYGAWSTTGRDYYNKILSNSKAMANTDVFATHFYGTPRNKMDFPALENCGKEIWMTEVYVPNSDANSANKWPEALDVAENIHNGLVVGNLSVYTWWYIKRSYGLISQDGSNGSITKRGYMMAQYSKWVRPGDIRIDVTESPASDLYISAYKNENHQVTVVAVNKSKSAVNQQFQLGSGEKITNVDRYRTTSSENIALTENMEFDGSSFWSQLPAESVSTFVISLEGSGTTPGTQLDEDGYYFHDTFDSTAGSWQGRGAASVEQTASTNFAGTGSLSCTGRTASWNGASKNLSTRPFKAGETFSFSVNAKYETGGETEDFKLTLQYEDASGTAKYSDVATGTVSAGQWIQLSNENYTIPEGASNLVLYVETVDSQIDFFIDEAIGAPAGTKVTGAGKPVVRTLNIGDLNFDGKITVFDLILARRVLTNGTTDALVKKAADVDSNGTVEVADIVSISGFLLGRVKEFPKPEIVSTKWDDYQETESADWINFYQSSICNMGNVDRLANKLAAAENGEDLTLAYLGGSITEGKNYSNPFSSYVKSTFAKGKFTEINAGLSGTSSVVGLVRAQNEILNAKPDIVVLEFSVNDHEGETYKKSFESLVKKCLSQENEPAVIVLINRSKGGFSSQTQMEAIGKNFKVPVISMNNALTKAFNSGFLKTDDYFTDEYHPHENGGKLIANCMAYFLRQAMKSSNRTGSYEIPTSKVYGYEYETCANAAISELSGFNAGSFSSTTGYGKLPYGYANSKNGNTPMTFKVNAKGFILVFKANSTGMGNVVVNINGKKVSTISGNKQYTWGGPDAELAYYQDTAGELDVSIQMENAGSDFTIWGIGIIK
ncbi:MAG: carbohydrate binding domain-containing protein [Ruminococcus sp.]|nr:carbohydrate binding domain-containing protein [Ruminococcus sp.]